MPAADRINLTEQTSCSLICAVCKKPVFLSEKHTCVDDLMLQFSKENENKTILNLNAKTAEE
jgi:hypothetical protein